MGGSAGEAWIGMGRHLETQDTKAIDLDGRVNHEGSFVGVGGFGFHLPEVR